MSLLVKVDKTIGGGHKIMTLEKHIIDTMKEWQIKIGSFDTNIRLYYPKTSLCRYLNLSMDIDNELLIKKIEQYFADHISYLGNVTISAKEDRFCIEVGEKGCAYVEKKVQEPEFLTKFLVVLKSQKMQNILEYFEEYAKEHETCVCTKEEESGLETVVYFEDESIEPYVYCIDENEFGITYHRFTKEEYMDL
ncbi:MAG: DUF3877 family protein [Lachnospiraceae bacterium]|nr:DUF3877 family protein [Lachnospiraceae bacterium]